MKKSQVSANITKQARSLITMNPYFREHPDENVYIYWKSDKPYVLPHKMSQKEARTNGFETIVNTIKLSSILK